MYQYPYGDTQQLNLDWILTKIKELEAGGSGGGSSIEDVANTLISATYNAAAQYRRYDYCFYNGKLYRCLTDTTGAFNPADWQEALIGDDIPILTRLLNAIDAAAVVDVKFDTSGTNGKLQQKYHDEYHDVVEVDYTPVQNSKRPLSSNAGYELNGAINLAQNNIAFVESGTTATRTYIPSRFIIVGGQLYITTDVITSGSTFINGTNIKPVNLSSRLEAVSITDDITVDTTKAADVVGRRYGNLVMISGGIVASSDAAGFVTNIPKVSGIALGLTLINSTGLPLTTGGVWLERNQTQLNFYGSCPSRCTFQVIYITDD